jgi:AraC-like DNA-binding protein
MPKMTTAANQIPESTALPEEEILKTIAGLVGSIEGPGSIEDDAAAYEIIAFEEQVFHYVSSGELQQLMHLSIPEASIPPEGIDPASHLRFLLASLNATCLHAAVEGGVSRRISYRLNRKLSSRILGCNAVDELLELAGSQIIPLSYCLLVRQLSFPGIKDKDIVRAIRYIHDHHHERISLRELADHVGLSPEYLSAKFKRETGVTTSRYISKMHVEEAKALLRFTDLSIGEIAAQLVYSSQSHFQSAFKRETGTTPQQYRMSVAE